MSRLSVALLRFRFGVTSAKKGFERSKKEETREMCAVRSDSPRKGDVRASSGGFLDPCISVSLKASVAFVRLGVTVSEFDNEVTRRKSFNRAAGRWGKVCSLGLSTRHFPAAN